MKCIDVSTQEEFDAAAAQPDACIHVYDSATVTAYDSATVRAYGSATVRASGSATVTAYDSATVTAYDSATVRAYGSATVTAYDSATVTAYDSATVTAYGSATVTAYDSATVTAYDSATVTAYDSATVTAYDSATVTAYDSATVTAYDSATVRASGSATVRAYGSATVTAYDSATVRAYGSATVRASEFVAVQDHGPSTSIDGGVLISIRRAETAEQWCEFYGVDVSDGIAVLFKGVDDTFISPHGLAYTPGSTPEAPDWDGGKAECGGGLHFSPRPIATLAFTNAARFVACPVRLADIVVHPNGYYPEKVKAPRCAGPVWEVDIDGEPVPAKAEVA